MSFTDSRIREKRSGRGVSMRFKARGIALCLLSVISGCAKRGPDSTGFSVNPPGRIYDHATGVFQALGLTDAWFPSKDRTSWAVFVLYNVKGRTLPNELRILGPSQKPALRFDRLDNATFDRALGPGYSIHAVVGGGPPWPSTLRVSVNGQPTELSLSNPDGVFARIYAQLPPASSVLAPQLDSKSVELWTVDLDDAKGMAKDDAWAFDQRLGTWRHLCCYLTNPANARALTDSFLRRGCSEVFPHVFERHAPVKGGSSLPRRRPRRTTGFGGRAGS